MSSLKVLQNYINTLIRDYESEHDKSLAIFTSKSDPDEIELCIKYKL